ncbi:MAG TPA: hypothetical protein VK524_04670 [Polyangiaceae bacterium]|nr:hypothetical protein [Polyangiaceae bacterium]
MHSEDAREPLEPGRRKGPVVAWYWAMLIVLTGTIAMGLGIRALFP